MADKSDLIIRIASVPCGASDAFLHPACVTMDNLQRAQYHDLTIAELLAQQIVYCDACSERIVPKHVGADHGR